MRSDLKFGVWKHVSDLKVPSCQGEYICNRMVLILMLAGLKIKTLCCIGLCVPFVY